MFIALVLPACGIVFSADFEGTEVFRDLELAGEFTAGSPVTVTVTLTQAYPVPVALYCGYEDVDISDDERQVAFSERAQPVYEAVLGANPGDPAGEDKGAEAEALRFDFTVNEPGDYFIACFTVAAPENGIGRRFTVEAP